MKRLIYIMVGLSLGACVYNMPDDDIAIGDKKVSLILDNEHAITLASLPMACMEREYPNKLNQVLSDSSQLMGPKALHPAFYGCFDWHSAVHGQWLLVRLMKEFPEIDQSEIREKLGRLLTKENLEEELAYFQREENASFERTYGWAWLLRLHGETYQWEDTLGKQIYENLKPLADHIVQAYLSFLPKLNFPIRNGEHTNTAFGLSAAYDYARKTGQLKLLAMISTRARSFYEKDEDVSLAFEPSGFDFLSPILEEARLMQKVMNKEDYMRWLNRYLPSLFNPRFKMEPADVTDRTDGKLVHLDGVNLSRARCLYVIARQDKRLAHLRQVADLHLQRSLPRIVDGEYMGEHWLASFALNALLERKAL
ncbi:MAG: DUF2891 domain-containing protein [Crocinitomicaceae bacterium]|jgi:hypothetical protein|nr:DUF2891 domain-containing protein [Crocinitomicaceae bacterium]